MKRFVYLRRAALVAGSMASALAFSASAFAFNPSEQRQPSPQVESFGPVTVAGVIVVAAVALVTGVAIVTDPFRRAPRGMSMAPNNQPVTPASFEPQEEMTYMCFSTTNCGLVPLSSFKGS